MGENAHRVKMRHKIKQMKNLLELTICNPNAHLTYSGIDYAPSSFFVNNIVRCSVSIQSRVATRPVWSSPDPWMAGLQTNG